MSVYLYTLRKSNPTVRSFKSPTGKRQIRIYNYKFASANATSSWNESNIEGIIKKAKNVWAEAKEENTPIIVNYHGSLYLQRGEGICTHWWDTNNYDGIEIGEMFNGKPYFCGDGIDLLLKRFGVYVPISYSGFSSPQWHSIRLKKKPRKQQSQKR